MVAIVKYNAGNIRSVMNALSRLNVDSVLTDDPNIIRQADKVIFPGVGEASTAMNYLRDKRLDRFIKQLKQPFLGICLGLQLMCRYSEEGNTECLDIFPEQVKKFPPTGKVPHIGWNDFKQTKGPLFQGIKNNDDLYFVHSYYVEVGPDTLATTEYILPFSAALQKNNFYGVQFHPEKSADVGQRLLNNFLAL